MEAAHILSQAEDRDKVLEKTRKMAESEQTDLEVKMANLSINSALPPELLSSVFRFLPFADLKNALAVCRCFKRNVITKMH